VTTALESCPSDDRADTGQAPDRRLRGWVAQRTCDALADRSANPLNQEDIMLDDLPEIPHADRSLPGTLELGAFSVSLNVADLDSSQRFYASLGFVTTGGDPDHGYVIMRNGDAMLGLFHGMFDGNILTFNPGLTGRMERVREFTDVREIERSLRAAGIDVGEAVAADAGDAGPGHITLTDPDGNAILIDQFF
jgi:catechol 2,3-dioxygenase-like lactoylglutathione lyase family enzyme